MALRRRGAAEGCAHQHITQPAALAGGCAEADMRMRVQSTELTSDGIGAQRGCVEVIWGTLLKSRHIYLSTESDCKTNQ